MSDFIPDSERIDLLRAENAALRKQLSAVTDADLFVRLEADVRSARKLADERLREMKLRDEEIVELCSLNDELIAQLNACLPAAKRDAERQFADWFAQRVSGLTAVEQRQCAGGRKVLIRLQAGDLAFEREVRREQATWDAELAALAVEAGEYFARNAGVIDLGPRLNSFSGQG